MFEKLIEKLMKRLLKKLIERLSEFLLVIQSMVKFINNYFIETVKSSNGNSLSSWLLINKIKHEDGQIGK